MAAEYDPTALREQAEAKARAGQAAEVKAKREAEEFRWLMSQPQFRRWVWRQILEKAGVYRTSFTGNSATFFNEGMRNMGLMVLGQINELTPELYATMLKESKDE